MKLKIDLDTLLIIITCQFYTGCLSGALSSLTLRDLCSPVIKDVLKRAEVKPEEVSEVIIGHVLTAGKRLSNLLEFSHYLRDPAVLFPT